MIEIIVTTDRIATDPDGRQLLDHINQNGHALGIETAVVYYDFPSYADYDAIIHRPDILLLSKTHGAIAIKFAGGDELFRANRDASAIDSSLEQFCSILLGRLLKSRTLKKNRSSLKFDITPVIWVAGANPVAGNYEAELISSYEGFGELLQRLDRQELDDDELAEARSVVEGAKAITRPLKRIIEDPGTMPFAAAIAKLEGEIANFDQTQRQSALSLVQGPQRIRGLAGSGKTVILAMKAAHIHLTHPDAHILITFYTKSLRNLFKTLISRFYRHYKDEDPDWSKVHIRHGWGTSSTPGVYGDACRRAGLAPTPFSEARKFSREPFDYVCQQLLKKDLVEEFYDYVLIDEGQDFPSSFYELIYSVCKGGRDRKNIVWAYDELQNILNISIRSPAQLFGQDEHGQPRVDLDRSAGNLPRGTTNDIVLSKCYRNQREVLVTAHAMGFGVYGTPVQMLQDEGHWQDVGYQVVQGPLEIGRRVRIFRPPENSPMGLDAIANVQLIESTVAADLDQEIEWITGQAKAFIAGGLKPEDIIIIALDDRHARGYFRRISEVLADSDIETNNILADPYNEPPFTIEGKITLSTVYRAKGNEAAVIFACGIDAVDGKGRDGRNKLFTAFTRSKAWLRVSGMGASAQAFITEVNTAVSKCPYLDFVMPDRVQIETIQRDYSERAAKALRARNKFIAELKGLGYSDEEIAEQLGIEARNG